MAVRSVYLPQAHIDGGLLRDNEGRLLVDGSEHRHLAVARAEVGETVEVFNGNGDVWAAVVETLGRRETILHVREHRLATKPSLELILGLSLVKPSAFELAVEKAVEVGVTRIIPIIAARSNVKAGRLTGGQDRWTRIMVEAAKQSKTYYLPQIESPVALAGALDVPAATKIVFAEHNGGPLQSALAGSPAFFLVGPEGGWTDEELEALAKKGFAAVTLGANILKTETAAIAGAVLIQYALGGRT